jgi:hypothetical protein
MAGLRRSWRGLASCQRGGGLAGPRKNGAWKERGRGLATHNFQMKFQTAKSDSYTFFPKNVAHFVWEKCRAWTTYIVKGVPREKK